MTVPHASATIMAATCLAMGIALTSRAESPEIEALFDQATSAYDRGDFESAIEYWQQVLTIDPDHPIAHYDLCAAYNKAEQVPVALEHCDRAIGLDPQYVDAYYLRGLIYSEKLGENRRAIADFDAALQVNDKEVRAYFKRGNARTRLGDNAGAIDDYDTAIALDPNDADAYFNRGVVYYNLQNPEAALDDLIRSEELYADRGDSAGREKAASAIAQVMNEMGNR